MLVLGEPTPSPEIIIEDAIRAMLNSGFKPGNKAQGYALRRLLRLLWKRGGSMDHLVFHTEVERQERLKKTFERLRMKNLDKSAEWWFDTHGIDVSEMS